MVSRFRFRASDGRKLDHDIGRFRRRGDPLQVQSQAVRQYLCRLDSAGRAGNLPDYDARRFIERRTKGDVQRDVPILPPKSCPQPAIDAIAAGRRAAAHQALHHIGTQIQSAERRCARRGSFLTARSGLAAALSFRVTTAPAVLMPTGPVGRLMPRRSWRRRATASNATASAISTNSKSGGGPLTELAARPASIVNPVIDKPAASATASSRLSLCISRCDPIRLDKTQAGPPGA